MPDNVDKRLTSFSLEIAGDDDELLVKLAGELDVASVPDLDVVTTEAIARGVKRVAFRPR